MEILPWINAESFVSFEKVWFTSLSKEKKEKT